MNDPRVIALHYRVRHHDRVDYSEAGPLVASTPEFRLEVRDQEARFEFEPPYPRTVEEARGIVEPFVRNWEFDAGLSHDPGYFKLKFKSATREASSGTGFRGFGYGSLEVSLEVVKAIARPTTYPELPSGIDSAHDDVQFLLLRYERFKARKALLPDFAYYCYTKICCNGRDDAADRYKVSRNLLERISKLSSREGGPDSRKASKTEPPLTQDERRWLERAVVRLIRRVAEYHANPDSLCKLTVTDIR